MRKSVKKLSLSRETLRALSLQQVSGAAAVPTTYHEKQETWCMCTNACPTYITNTNCC